MLSSSSEFDVNQIKQRIRSDVARDRSRFLAGQRDNGHDAGTRAAQPSYTEELQFWLSGKTCQSEKLGTIIETARAKTAVNRWIPKFLRRFFRRQGGFNNSVISALKTVLTGLRNLETEQSETRAYLGAQYYRLRDLADSQQQFSGTLKSLADRVARQDAALSKVEIERQWDGEAITQLRGFVALLLNNSDRNFEMATGLKTICQDLIETTAVAAKKSQDLEERLQSALPRLETLSGQLRHEIEVRDRFVIELRGSLAQESEAWRRATQELQAAAAQERERSQAELAQERDRTQAELAQVRERGEAELSQLRTRLEDLTSTAAASANDVARILDEQHKQSDELSRHADRQVESDSALRANLEHLKASGQVLQAYLERLENRQLTDATYLKDEILVHRHVFRELVSRGVASAHSQKEEGSRVLDHEHNAFYLAFENRFRGSRDDVKSRCEVYLPYLASVTVPKPDCHILDVGCGRGEWLELLRQNDFVNLSGVDTNVVMAAQCRDQGFSVEIQDCVDHLASLQTGSLTVITAFHVIEHLPFERQMSFLSEAYRVLARGGMLIFETPNPDNLIVAAKNFYIDPTHRRPLPSPLAAFLVEYTGFSNVEVVNQHPFGADVILREENELAVRFNQLFYSDQDYGVIARKTV